MMHETGKKETALLVMVETEKPRWSKAALTQEFRNLVSSTGIQIKDVIAIKRRVPVPGLFIGKGKAQELAALVEDEGADVVVFNNELTVSQQRNLEDVLGVKTIDRTQLILDIFAAHARTQEGILQVELAQLEYLRPRLKGKGIALSRLGGGIGTIGPGEKKLEVDRRRIAERIARLKNELESVKQHRTVMRKKRQKENVRVCSLIGYTNAGKSTLFNALTQGQEKTSSSLFSTLDTVSHTFVLRNKLEVLLTDTVGFLYKLPHRLIESFMATLEELHHADIIVHVLDCSTQDIRRLEESVDSVLEELELVEKPTLLVLNKIDLLREEERTTLKERYSHAFCVSALTGLGLDALKDEIYKELFSDQKEVIVRLPFSRMEVLKYIHAHCEVLKVTYQEEEAVYWVRGRASTITTLQKQGVSVKEI